MTLAFPFAPKYVMTSEHPIPDFCPQPLPQFIASSMVSIPVRPDECPDEVADRLRQWCIENCHGRWKPLERWTRSAVRIEFENLTDATLFQLAH